jgi:hypothetical protein
VKLAEVDPDWRGVRIRTWRLDEISRQAAEYRISIAGQEAPLERKAIATARDGYGWRRGHDNRSWYERHEARSREN